LRKFDVCVHKFAPYLKGHYSTLQNAEVFFLWRDSFYADKLEIFIIL